MYISKAIYHAAIILICGLWFLSGVLFISGCSSTSATSVKLSLLPDQTGKLKSMIDSADAMYKLAKEGKFADARERLEQFADLMVDISYRGVTTADGLNALAELVADSRRIFNRVQFSPVEGRLAAAKLRLAADALEHKEQPMWLQYRRLFMEDAKRLSDALKRGERASAVDLLQNFQQHYSIIRPAVLITRDPSLIEKVDSWFAYMNDALNGSNTNHAKTKEIAAQSGHWIPELFAGGDAAAIGQAAADRQPIIWASVLVAAILSVLVYVGWKKYKFSGG